MRSSIFLGVDQTGAVDRKGVPKALPLVVLAFRQRQWQLSAHWIPTLNAKVIKDITNTLVRAESLMSDWVAVVDCVFGLPQSVFPKDKKFRQILMQAKTSTGFGRKSAQEFFAPWTPDVGAVIPQRQVEAQVGANSVLKVFPMQKNIQTGTYRIWKDLAEDPDWFCFPYLEKPQPGLCQMFEGYPSLSWKQLFNVKKREPQDIVKHVQKRFTEVKIDSASKAKLTANADLADAAVLALAGYHWVGLKKQVPQVSPRTRQEGWILGADNF